MSDRTQPPAPAGGPVRTCVGCRRRAPRSLLIRIVLDHGRGTAVVDPGRCAPGRGAWLHPSPACLELARRRRALPRALRTAGATVLTEVETWFQDNHR